MSFYKRTVISELSSGKSQKNVIQNIDSGRRNEVGKGSSTQIYIVGIGIVKKNNDLFHLGRYWKAGHLRNFISIQVFHIYSKGLIIFL